MTVTNSDVRTSAVGTNTIGQEVPFTSPIKSTSDITVRSVVTATDVISPLTETTNYTVVINGNSGGTVTMVTAVATTSEIHIERTTPVTQLLDLEQGGAFNAPDLESMGDKNTRISADNADAVSRCMRFPAAESVSITSELPNITDRKSKVLSFDSSGNATATAAVPTGSVSFSTYGTNVAEAANALAAKPVHNLDHVFDVRDFGAVGDGVTDDTVAVQAALDAAKVNGPTGGGTVHLPTGPNGGNYAFAGELTLDSSGITMTGATPYGEDAQLTYSGSGTFITVNNAFCVIKNLRIIGPDSPGSDIAIFLGTDADAKRENSVRECLIRDWSIGIQNKGQTTIIEKCDIVEISSICYDHVSGVAPQLIRVYMTGEAAAICVRFGNAGNKATLDGCSMTSAAIGVDVLGSGNVNSLTMIGCHFEQLTSFDVRNLDASSSTLMMGCQSSGNIQVSSAEATLISNWFDNTTSKILDVANSNWVMLNNRNITAADFQTGAGNVLWLDQNRLGLVAFDDADATPNVNGGFKYSTNNSSAGDITDFDKGWAGLEITVIGNDAGLTTIVHGQGIRLANLRDITLLDGDTLTLLYNGTDWFQTGINYNSGSSVPFIVCNDNQVVCNENQVVVN